MREPGAEGLVMTRMEGGEREKWQMKKLIKIRTTDRGREEGVVILFLQMSLVEEERFHYPLLQQARHVVQSSSQRFGENILFS